MGELGEGLSGYLDVENATLRAPRLEATSNIGIANTAPRHAFSVGSNLYVSTDSSNVLTVNGNVACEGIKMGLIEITPSYDLAAVSNVGNVTQSTIQFSNATTGFVTTSNVEIGGGTIFSGHILPSADNTYDIGSAAFKIRDMYISDNSLWIGDDTKLSITEGELKFRKRNTGVVPKGITDMGGTGSAALTHAGVSDINDMKLHHWEAYAKSIDAAKTTKDIFTDDVENYETSAIKTFNTSNVMTIGTTKTFVVTVSDASGANKYYIDGIQQPYLTLHQHQTYIFDLSSPTLVDHPFIFSETADGIAYTTGITTTGAYGSTEKRTFIVPAGAPATLYYYCTAHAGMGATVSISSEAELVVSGRFESTGTTLDKGSLSLTRSLDVPRVSRYDVDTETPRPEKLVLDFDTTVNNSPTDISGKGNHGTMVGATYSAADKAFNFDGTNNYILSQSISGTSTGAFVHSLCVWAKFNTGTGNAVLSLGTFVGSNGTSTIHANGNGTFSSVFNDNSVHFTTDMTTNTWYFIVITYDGGSTVSSRRAFVNGKEVSQSGTSGTITSLSLPTNPNLYVGGQSNGSQDFDGQISNPKIYNVALEPSEVQKLYRLGRTGRSMVISDTAVGIGKVPEAQLDVRGALRSDGLTVGGDIYATGNITGYSDRRAKSDIEKIENALDKIEQLNGYTFTMKGKRYTGLIAQEILPILPEAVTGSEETNYAVAYGNMMGLIVEAIKELKQKIG